MDVLERVLDRGIVLDAWADISVAGIDLLSLEARVVVASIETYLNQGEKLRQYSYWDVRSSAGPADLAQQKSQAALPSSHAAVAAVEEYLRSLRK